MVGVLGAKWSGRYLCAARARSSVVELWFYTPAVGGSIPSAPTSVNAVQRWLAENTADTNTKLLLITTPDHRAPAHTLTAAADQLLPWAHHLGSPNPGHQRPSNAIERADQHLTTATPDKSPEH